MISKEEFELLDPKSRGYIVYLKGAREDEPNVPDEDNPYPEDTEKHKWWNEGQDDAMILAQDSP